MGKRKKKVKAMMGFQPSRLEVSPGPPLSGKAGRAYGNTKKD